jgi:signal transduction histidine kinase
MLPVVAVQPSISTFPKLRNFEIAIRIKTMNSIKIMIVEDEQLVADDLRETLESLGYEVPALVASGEEAIIQAELIKPDLILMDIRLEGKMDGIGASMHIQSRFHIPVVYLTANADRATLERAKISQPFGYILKPFNEKILSTTIEIALSRHQAEVEVQKALFTVQAGKFAAESQTEKKSQYLYMAAHEFRNPLTAIKFGTEMLKEYSDKISEDKKQKHIQLIETATDSLINLLEEILTLGKTESGKFEFYPSLIDVVSFCEDIIEALQVTIGQQYDLQFIFEGYSRIAYLDEHLLWHLLNNLLSNAIKYSPINSVISLLLIREPDNICFQIKDQGIGIPQESQSQLFQPFHRASNVGNIPGTGLGLAIIKQCVELHSGTIDFVSQLGQGTTFCVKLPLKS